MKKITNYIEENKGKKIFSPLTEEQYEKAVSIMENRLKEGEIEVKSYRYDSNGKIVECDEPIKMKAEALVQIAKELAISGIFEDDDNC